MITFIEDVKVGHWITFRSTYNGVLRRKFYEVVLIEEPTYYCYTYGLAQTRYDTTISDLFECPDDEVYESLAACEQAYPEEFI